MNAASELPAGGPARFLNPLARELMVKPRNPLLALAARYQDVVSLGRGDPDLPTPAHIVAAAKEAVDRGATHYTGVNGIPELCQAIADKLERENGVRYDPASEIIVTCGCQEAITLAAVALLAPGYEMLAGDPRYTSYDLAARLAGGKVVSVPRRPGEGFRLHPDDVRRAIGPRTKALALVSPDNPTGAVSTLDDLEAIAGLARAHDLVVVSDEIYEKILFDGTVHHSIAALPGMRDRTVIINGFSKAYCMSGWRVGFLAGPAPLVAGIVNLKHTLSICTPAVSQWAALAALQSPPRIIQEIVEIYTERRDTLTDAFNAAGLPCPTIKGGTFLFASVEATGMSADAFARWLLHEARILVYPGDYFGEGGAGWVRVTLFAPTDRVKEAAARIRATVPARTKRAT